MGNGCEQELLHEALKTETGFKQWIGDNILDIRKDIKEIKDIYIPKIERCEKFVDKIITGWWIIAILSGVLAFGIGCALQILFKK